MPASFHDKTILLGFLALLANLLVEHQRYILLISELFFNAILVREMLEIICLIIWSSCEGKKMLTKTDKYSLLNHNYACKEDGLIQHIFYWVVPTSQQFRIYIL